ncbi:MFS transporter [Nocardia sp. NBC_01730]|uniref:MFS transporter n=1 Tax=Nocardia sp. NBC_01730 TaxID=2975998 RepID=UPI002E0DA76F|nr:MFS transporter [Nocardia sp. NBC_01730]
MTSPTQPRHAFTLVLLAFAQFIIAIDYNIVYVALPGIGHDLGFSTQSLQWVVSAYAVGLGGLLLLGGRAVDRLGRRRLFMLGLTVYGASSLLGGLAVAPGMLIGARAIQGFGGALLTPATLALIATVFAEGPQRNRAMAVWGTAGGAGLAAGSLLGGVLADTLGWQWVFFVNIPLTAVAALAAQRLLPADPSPRIRDGFDLPGALVATLGASLLVFGLASGPEAGWTSPHGAGAIAAGAGLLTLFVLIERRARDPLMPLQLLRIRSLTTAMAVMFIFMGTLSGQYYVFTVYLQNVLGFDALHAGLAFLPLTLIAIVSTERLVAPLLQRWGLRTTLWVGLLVNAIGMLAFTAAISAGSSYWALLPGIVIWGAGSFTYATMFVAAATDIVPAQQGIASGLANTTLQIGGAVGLAVLVAVTNTTSDPETAEGITAGLRAAGWTAAAALLCAAAIAATLEPSVSVAPTHSDQHEHVQP